MATPFESSQLVLLQQSNDEECARFSQPHGDQQLSFLSSFFLLRAVLLEPQFLDIMIVQFRNEKVSNHGSIPITIDCNVVAFIVFEEGFHQSIKRTKQRIYYKAAIRKSVIPGTKLSTKFASYTRDVLLERTERAIAIWIEEQVQRRIPVKGYLIQEKALQFYKSMKQNALHNIKITGESATADEGAAKIFPEELAKIIEDEDYSADQVFNADETGLYWKKLPNRTYIAKDEKTASGRKASKD
ncbi:tigger transposable element-derived protein 1 [Trichonephila clavipes]|nr:tigger transposable element-derived protein 1 [Trichonephila clavipes]